MFSGGIERDQWHEMGWQHKSTRRKIFLKTAILAIQEISKAVLMSYVLISYEIILIVIHDPRNN